MSHTCRHISEAAQPNLAALMGLVGAAGFSDAEILSGEPTNDERTGDGPHHYRAIVRAIK